MIFIVLTFALILQTYTYRWKESLSVFLRSHRDPCHVRRDRPACCGVRGPPGWGPGRHTPHFDLAAACCYLQIALFTHTLSTCPSATKTPIARFLSASVAGIVNCRPADFFLMHCATNPIFILVFLYVNSKSSEVIFYLQKISEIL